MRNNKIRAQIGYKRKYMKGGKTANVAANILNRNFDPAAPNQYWVSDITYVRTYEGFLYVALLMAVMTRQPDESLLVHSDQGSQYGSVDYLAFMKANNLEPSMSRRGNCHDNAVAESFFATFKKRVTKRKIYTTRDEAKTEIFNFIEMFYNPIKRHSHTGGVSPVKFEEDYFSRLESG